MPYVIRNTIFIAVFWLIILIGGLYYVYGYQAKKHTSLEAEIKQKTNRVNDLKMMQITRHELTQEYDYLRDLSLGKLGALAGNESPGETFDYMLREIDHTSSKLVLNQELVVKEKFKDFERNTYLLSGESEFEDFYRLIWFLENGPIFYNIQSVSMDRIPIEQKKQEEWAANRGELTFALSVWGFRKEKGLEMDSLRRNVGKPEMLASLVDNSVSEAIDNILKAEQSTVNVRSTEYSHELVTLENSNPQAERGQGNSNVTAVSNPLGLPEISPATEVLAITPNSVLIRDQHGRIKKLRKGDRVLGGTVGNINVQSGRVGFYMNAAGGYNSLELSLTKK